MMMVIELNLCKLALSYSNVHIFTQYIQFVENVIYKMHVAIVGMVKRAELKKKTIKNDVKNTPYESNTLTDKLNLFYEC